MLFYQVLFHNWQVLKKYEYLMGNVHCSWCCFSWFFSTIFFRPGEMDYRASRDSGSQCIQCWFRLKNPVLYVSELWGCKSETCLTGGPAEKRGGLAEYPISVCSFHWFLVATFSKIPLKFVFIGLIWNGPMQSTEHFMWDLMKCEMPYLQKVWMQKKWVVFLTKVQQSPE